MKKLLTIVTCLVSLHYGKAIAQPMYTDTTLTEQNASQGISYLKTFPAAANIAVQAVANQVRLNAFENNRFKICLDSLQKEVPLDHNEFVQSYIDQYTAPSRRADRGRILGLAKYYFPIYEKAFRDAGIPDEIKYLSIVESELNPNAISRVGATGPWQFMYATARNYGLNINNYVDERRDPVQASYAAAAYLKDAYQEFGDWLLAIASYNCGKGNVERAMEKTGASDFWSIREYLPAETRGYVPAFIATAYVMNNYYKHGITAQSCNLILHTDTVLVDKFVSLSNVARVLDMDAGMLALLNPAYTKRVVNGTPKAPRRLVIPQLDKSKYSALYDALNGNSLTVPATPVYASVPEGGQAEVASKLPSYHTVKKGDTLAGIADQYGVEIEDLKIWNNLRTNKATPGQRLKISLGDSAASKVSANKVPGGITTAMLK
jgi:membrane-bound lytic murein transglycosylase D